jgi:hypothetical protein
MVHDIQGLFSREQVEVVPIMLPTNWCSEAEVHSLTSILAVEQAYLMSFYFPCLYNY